MAYSAITVLIIVCSTNLQAYNLVVTDNRVSLGTSDFIPNPDQSSTKLDTDNSVPQHILSNDDESYHPKSTSNPSENFYQRMYGAVSDDWNYVSKKVAHVEKDAAKVVGQQSKEVERAIESQINQFGDKASNITSDIGERVQETYNKTTSVVSNVYAQVSTEVSSVANSSSNFVSSSWSQITGWWYQLEDELKEFIHISLRVIEVVVVLVVLFLVLWGCCKIRIAYRFIKNHTTLPEELEMHTV